MENKIKFSIIIICVTICILLVSIIALKLVEKKNIEEEEKLEIENAEKIKVSENVNADERTHIYLRVNDILDRVFYYISEEEKYVKNAEALINLLDNEYKQKNNITEANVLEFFKQYKNVNSYFTKEIYTQKISHRQAVKGNYLYIKGIVRKNGLEENIYLLMKQDLYNSTYSLSFLTEQEFNEKGKENTDIEIEKNNYNSMYNKGIDDYQICLAYLKDYINAVTNSPEKAYELLNEEYKTKRFANVENYKKYINELKEQLSTTVLKSYTIEKNDDITQYMCVDQRGRYYIFDKLEMMNYTVSLDSYTIDSPKYIESYNKANSKDKVGYNIQRCIEAINNKDYSYVYNKLDNEFKANNYKTEKEFENAIKEKLFDTNKIVSSSTSNEGDIYIYSLNITDTENEKNKATMSIIMQLKDNTDFVMSFSFN